uniref:Putative tRNA (cytidine(32)/guanosine(34)-2'-O)-methyltransferase n=1 Tax=Aceria tosichella TaxID=561515 RepID=A0A6G1SAS0_9ACAR
MGKSSKDKQDVFYRLAKEEGWRARSAFKLLQINEQFGLFDGVSRAVDLCAAPGSWSQVLTRKLRMRKKTTTDTTTITTTTTTTTTITPEATAPSLKIDDSDQPDHLGKDHVKILAVDIQTMAPIDGVTIIQGDITRFETADKIINEFKGAKAQLVVCDGAPDVTGQHDLDEFMQSQLLLAALNITTFIIEEGGTFVAKIFRGKDISVMVIQFRLFFEQVQVIKPKSSRALSIEAFICCRNFKLPPNYKPQMFDLLTDFTTGDLQNHYHEMDCNARMIIPFLMCGDLQPLGGGSSASG